jgi:hypothetical protein
MKPKYFSISNRDYENEHCFTISVTSQKEFEEKFTQGVKDTYDNEDISNFKIKSLDKDLFTAEGIKFIVSIEIMVGNYPEEYLFNVDRTWLY